MKGNSPLHRLYFVNGDATETFRMREAQTGLFGRPKLI